MVFDTGPLFALVNSNDANHERCVAWFERFTRQLLIPVMVLTEVAYHLQTQCDSQTEAKFFRDVAKGEYGEVLSPDLHELARIGDLVENYGDWPLGGVDASVIALAERWGCTDIATLDHRHFAAVRPLHVDYFTLLP